MTGAADARHPWKLPVLSGALLAISYFSFSLPVLNFLALVPLLAWIDAGEGRGWREDRKGALAFGFTVNVLILHWMLSMVWVSVLGVLAWLGLALLFGLATAACVVAVAWARRATGWSFAVVLPPLWLTVELLQGQGDLRMTAQQLGHALAGAPFLVQFVDLTGPYGAGALVLVTNALVYETWRRRPRALAALVAVWAVVLAYDAWAWTRPEPATETVRVAFVQPDVPLKVKMARGTEARQWEALSRLTLRAGDTGAELVVWPESARPWPLFYDEGRPESWSMPDVAGLARATGAAMVVGTELSITRRSGGREYYNAVVSVRPDGTVDPAWTAKTYLVPFVEGVPFRPVLEPILGRLRGSLRWLAGGFERGEPGTVLDAAGTKVGATVCFEELYFDLHRELRNAGARIQVVVTNHAWFRRTLFQRYAANSVRMRAIENRCAFVRAANTGYSAFYDAKGRMFDRSDLFTEDTRTRALSLAGPPTVYDRLGDVVAWFALAGCAIVVGVSRRRSR